MKRKSSPPKKITPELAEKAWTFWQQTQNMTALARHIGVNVETAHKLVHDGYPGAKIEPLATRYARLVSMTTQRADTKLADMLVERIVKARKNMLSLDRAAEILNVRLNEIIRAINDGEIPPDVEKMPFEHVVSVFDRATAAIDKNTRHATFCYNGGSDKIRVVETDPIGELMAAEIPGRSQEDMEYYLKHHKWPDEQR